MPQEGNATLKGMRKAVYALGEDGRVALVPSSGWQVEETVTLQAVDAYAAQAEEVRSRCARGEASPLEYHMVRARMEPSLLARYAGLWAWRVRRHLRPEVFRRLGPGLLARYAAALGLSREALGRTDL